MRSILFLCFLTACGGTVTSTEAPPVDSGPDAPPVDAAPVVDATADAQDAGVDATPCPSLDVRAFCLAHPENCAWSPSVADASVVSFCWEDAGAWCCASAALVH